MIKVSDYIMRFLEDKGVKHVFMLPGGGAMHLVDSLGYSSMRYIVCQHEQAAAIAAEAYGQHTNDIGVCLTTSGPGATNAITGVAAGFIDSTPMFVLSGQAKRSDLVGDRGVRQIGSQEVQIIDMVKPITKYAVQVMDPNMIRYHMERAFYEATSGRSGPVWLSIPLDVQAQMIEPEALMKFDEPEREKKNISTDVDTIIELLEESKRPLILAGNGIKLSNGTGAFYEMIKKMCVPVETTWKTIDMLGEDDPLYLGHPGAMGDRGANYIIQEADLLLSIGCRIDTSLTAFNDENFAKCAKKILVDIDENELRRMNFPNTIIKLQCDAKEFITELSNRIGEITEEKKDEWKEWITYGKSLREKYPTVTKEHREQKEHVSAYYFTELLCKYTSTDDVIVPESSGAAGEITYQAFKPKRGQKMKNAAGLGSMGFGLPYSIGSCFANNLKRTILINGDGAFQLNIQELETVSRLKLPLKIFIWNNGGYASIRNMQNNNFEGHQVASGPDSGLSMPNIGKIANAYGIPSRQITNNQELEEQMPEILAKDNNFLELIEIITAENDVVSPRTKSFRRPDGTMESSKLEDMWPRILVE